MTFKDRLRDAQFTTDAGTVFTFDVKTVERTGSRKIANHEMPEQNESIVQDLGLNNEPFTLELFFYGDDYDKTADAFFAALEEYKPGTLQHPRWGDLKVKAWNWTQTEAFVEDMRCAKFSVKFIRTSSAKWPTTSVNQKENVAAQIVSATLPAVVPANAADLAACKKIATPSTSLLSGLRSIAAGISSVTSTIEDYTDDITDAIEEYESATAEVMAATISLISAPGLALTSIYNKVTGFATVLDQLVTSAETNAQAALATVQQIGALFGILTATTCGTEAANATEAKKTTDAISDLSDTVWTNIEAIEASVAAAYEAAGDTETVPFTIPIDLALLAKQATSDAIDAIMQASTSLPRAQKIMLDADRTPIELAFTLYGDPEKYIDVISENNLQGDQIMIVPAGSEVVYYV